MNNPSLRALPAALAALCLLLSSAQGFAAGRAVDEKRPLAADGTLSVKNLAGSVEIRGWARNEVAISGTLADDVEALEISGDARQRSVVVRYPDRHRNQIGDTRLQLRVPARALLKVETVSADIRADEVSGALELQSVSGDIALDVGSGRIRVSTVSGDLRLKGQAYDTRMESVSGDVDASGLRGALSVETVSGDLQIAGGLFREVSLQSVSGDIELHLSLAESGRLNAETLSGDLDVKMPRAPAAAVSMKTFSGETHNGFGSTSGRGSISLRSFSGDIRLGSGD